ncbi:hypothetical protein WJX73_000205 [Symbiochloris irregularis]|uniref:Uncharacterized protein n=1 Tax=Symbiochloris irregularis TaxID=706552 RepID=A0AAW1NMF2_9CHLO
MNWSSDDACSTSDPSWWDWGSSVGVDQQSATGGFFPSAYDDDYDGGSWMWDSAAGSYDFLPTQVVLIIVGVSMLAYLGR